MEAFAIGRKLWSVFNDHFLSLITLVAVCAYATLVIRNDQSAYRRFPKLGKGLLEPWLRWETPTRWRLDEYEAEGYKKVLHDGKGMDWYISLTEPSTTKRANRSF